MSKRDKYRGQGSAVDRAASDASRNMGSDDVLFDPSKQSSADVWATKGSPDPTNGEQVMNGIFGSSAPSASELEQELERLRKESAIVKREDGTLQAGNVLLSETGIANIGELTEAELSTLGELLFQLDSSIQWWIGDWLNRVPQAWGTTIEAVAERTGKETKTLYEYQQVSRKIKIAERSAKLSWSHHRTIVYSLAPSEQYTQWIEWAENGQERRHSVRNLKTAIDQALKAPPENPDFDDVTARWATESARINLIQKAIQAGDKKEAREQIRILRAWLADLSQVLD
jgi:hypothetical protein